MTDTAIIGALIAGLFALVGVVWAMNRGDIAELKARLTSAERESVRIDKEHARSEERDKSFAEGITRLTDALNDFDRKIAAQIESLTRVLQRIGDDAKRRYSPPAGLPSQSSYHGPPIKREEDK